MTHPMLDLTAWNEANPDESLIIADGRSVFVNVTGGSQPKGSPRTGGILVVKDGPMGSPRERRIARVPRTIKHLAILTNHGSISLDAMAWLTDTEITYSVIDRSGKFPRLLSTSGGYVNPLYMRQQALCAPGGPAAYTGVKIMRDLITRKLEGQALNAERLRDTEAAARIREYLPRVAAARSVETIRGYEGAAADEYWNAWRGMLVSYLKWPSQRHWIEFPSRRTLRRSWESNRGATDPVNAMLNFGYKVAETECTLAAYAAALSPALGIGHVDRPGRDSFALDLIEPMRPVVDKLIIDILSEPLDKRWFREDNEGMVSCCAPLTHRIYSEVHQNTQTLQVAMFAVTALLGKVKRSKQTEV